MNMRKYKVVRIPRQPSAIQIVVDQKQLEIVEYFSYLGSRITNDARYTLDINTLRTGLLNCLNARSRGLTFRHRASCI